MAPELYQESLETGKPVMITTQTFRSRSHQVYAEQHTKSVITNICTKRHLLEDGISSYAYGHYKCIPDKNASAV